MSDKEHKAMAWLDGVASDRITYLRVVDGEYARTLKAMLARPVLPEEPSEELLDAMISAWSKPSRTAEGTGSRAAYRALYAHLTSKPVDQLDEIRRWGT